MENGDIDHEGVSRASLDYHYYDDYNAGELANTIYDESCMSGTTPNSTSNSSPWPGYPTPDIITVVPGYPKPDSSPWPGYPSGYSMTHIIISAVVVTAIMLVIVLGNVLVVAAVALERSLAAT